MSKYDMIIRKINHYFEANIEKTPRTLVVCLCALWDP